MNLQENTNNLTNTVTNVVQNISNETQNLVNNSTEKVKNISEQTLQKFSHHAKNLTNTIGNNIKTITTMLCSPALVFLAISSTTLSSSFLNGMDTPMFGIRLVKLILWTYCINYLCSSGYTFVSWAIVMIPYLLVPLQMLGVFKFKKQYLYLILSQDEQEFFGI